MERILLIAGCSHAAGSEIDGLEDSLYNRSNSFGNLLAKKLNRKPINIAVPGGTNTTISRSILNWVNNFHSKFIDLMVLVSWTDAARIEAIINWKNGHVPKNSDWFDKTANSFLRINQGTPEFEKNEIEILRYWKKFCAEQFEWLEIYSLNLVLQIQYFLKNENIDYVMCNAGHLTRPYDPIDHYIKLIDRNKFYQLDDPDQSFFLKYRSLGYKNPRAKYWHHDEVPHKLFADELYEFLKNEKSKII